MLWTSFEQGRHSDNRFTGAPSIKTETTGAPPTKMLRIWRIFLKNLKTPQNFNQFSKSFRGTLSLRAWDAPGFETTNFIQKWLFFLYF